MSMRGGALRQEAPTHQEMLLLDHAVRLGRSPAGRLAVHLHLSRLRPNNRREHHLRIAASSFDTLLKRHDGQMFHINGDDLVLLLHQAPRDEVDRVVGKVRYLFSDDPVAGEPGADFATWYDLARDYPAFRAMAEATAREAEGRRKLVAKGTDADDDLPRPPLTAQGLARLETSLVNMDLTSLLRRQPIAALKPGMEPRVVFNEMYVSIPELRRRVMPDADLTADPALFQHLTQALDQRVLSLLPQVDGHIPTATSVNVNVATLLSPQFQSFDAKLRQFSAKTIVFELQPADIFRDIGAYMFARDFVRERGYRLCLDGLNHLSYPLLRSGELGFDLEKILWASDLAAEGVDPRRERFRQAVKMAGAARVILCRCDGPEAVEFGHALGIMLFQGRYVDRIITGGIGTEAGGLPVG